MELKQESTMLTKKEFENGRKNMQNFMMLESKKVVCLKKD